MYFIFQQRVVPVCLGLSTFVSCLPAQYLLMCREVMAAAATAAAPGSPLCTPLHPLL